MAHADSWTCLGSRAAECSSHGKIGLCSNRSILALMSRLHGATSWSSVQTPSIWSSPSSLLERYGTSGCRQPPVPELARFYLWTEECPVPYPYHSSAILRRHCVGSTVTSMARLRWVKLTTAWPGARDVTRSHRPESMPPIDRRRRPIVLESLIRCST